MAEEAAAAATLTTPPSSAAPLGSSVIPIVNKLQDIFAKLGSQSTIELPQVAVVGSQSSGKSSVLEALVGRDFLPRGSDIAHVALLSSSFFRPSANLMVPMKNMASFFTCPASVSMTSLRFAGRSREAGGNKGLSDKQIRLKIFSPNVLDITLVDLPGITKVPVGDQPSDIEARIRTMIMSYIKQPSCLIIAVTPANSDLANSDALQIAGNADPDGYRTIGVITKLDIMDRGTDARNLLLGKVIPLRLGYIGVVNRSQEDILLNRSIKDALMAEEKFFRSHPVYNGLTDRCGVPQLAKKLNQILVQHIKAILPGLKSRISSALVSVAKEHASYGEITESKARWPGSSSAEYSVKMSTSELSGGARIHYIFQSIFVKSLEEVDPCEGLTDDDIRTAIQNATGPRSALFVPEVPFEVLVRRQIARLLDPSLQCARFIYDELIKISHRCMMNELQRFPVLRKHMDQMDYINTSHPNFIGGSKAVELANQQIKNSRVLMPVSKAKDGLEPDKAPTSERNIKSRAIIARQVNGIAAEQARKFGFCCSIYDLPSLLFQSFFLPHHKSIYSLRAGSTSGSTWGISSIFGGNDNRSTVKGVLTNKPYTEPAQNIEHSFSMIHLREPPTLLRPSECSETEAIEIAITKLLLRSYYEIVRKNVEDSVPKAIMHFLVNHSKRELHNVFIRKLYRESLFEEMLQEPDEIVCKRKRTRETLRVLQQAFRTLDELPLEAETVERGYSLGSDPTGLPKIHGLPTSSMYSPRSGSNDSYAASPKISKSRVSSHSGELQPHLFGGSSDSNGNGRGYMPGLYPTVDL
ncbi:Dynamin-related protein 3B [Hibiscus syriacus]|uniref:Dynamin-related protein 3B n=1 Tax=Hibiscus syriacus TaxID=106335 RepID=A0A6A2XZT9_HIBSY|nr:Dynamin-related protein 3B [Hibiscus syriacus]